MFDNISSQFLLLGSTNWNTTSTDGLLTANDSLSTAVVQNVHVIRTVDVYGNADVANGVNRGLFPRRPIPEQCRLHEFYLTALLSGSLCLIGLVGAILSFVGLRRDPSMSPAASFILQALACADAVLLSSWLVALSIPATLMFASVDQTLSAFWVVLHRIVGHSMLFIGQTTVAWLTVLVAVGRWATIRFPFRTAGPVCSKTVVRGAVSGVVFASVLFNAPKFFREKPGIYWGFVDQSNVTRYR
jgi:hypothetical protein